MPAETEWRVWRQLRGAFNLMTVHFYFVPIIAEMEGVNITQCETVEEALALATGKRIFLEPGGPHSLADVPSDEDLVLVLGNTEHGNSHLVQPGDYSVDLGTPGQTDLYGFNAAAIALSQMP